MNRNRVLVSVVAVAALLVGWAAAPLVLDALHAPTCHMRANAQTTDCLPILATNTALELENLRLQMTIQALQAGAAAAPTTPTAPAPATTATASPPAATLAARGPLEFDLRPQIITVNRVTFNVVIPLDWEDLGDGVFAPSADSLDAMLYVPSLPTVSETIRIIADELGVFFEAPTGRLASNGLEFTIYETSFEAEGTRQLIAIAPGIPTGVTVIVQTTPDQLEAYRTALFLPALEAISVVD